MWKKCLLSLFVSGLALPAMASNSHAAQSAKASTDATSVVLQALQRFAPGVKVWMNKPAPLAGFHQVIAGGRLLYISNDGKYMLNGDLIDLTKHEHLGAKAWSHFRKVELAKMPLTKQIVFAPSKPKYTVTVFTDITCGFCRALHKHINDYNKEGIAIRYMAWPRQGVLGSDGKPSSTYRKMVSVWCASHPKKALGAALRGQNVKTASCDNPVKAQFDLGLKLGITGTPSVIAEDGALIGGYLTPAQMLQAVRAHSTI